MSTCSCYGCFSWQMWLCNTARPLWSLSAVSGRELVCKQAVLLVNKQGFSPLVLSAIAENKHFRWRYWTLIFFHQTVHQFHKKYGLLRFLWHLQNIYCIRKSCILLDPLLKYPTIFHGSCIYLRCWNSSKSKGLLAVLPLEPWCSDWCWEGHISNCINTVHFLLFWFFFQSVDGSGSFTISPEDTVGMVGWLVYFI